MAEKRCELCRHWHPEMVGKYKRGTWGCCHTVHYQVRKTEGTKCPHFEPRLTTADIRKRWPELWAAIEGWERASEQHRCMFTFDDGRAINGKELASRARAQLLEALNAEEE